MAFDLWWSTNGLVKTEQTWRDFHHDLAVKVHLEIRRCRFDLFQVKEETEFPHPVGDLMTLQLQDLDSEP